MTDANLVVGRLDARFFPAAFGPRGDAPLDVAAAHTALDALAAAIGATDATAAAEGFLAVAVEQTAAAVRRLSTERGFDPRDHALVAFGGAAGQIVCDVADGLGITEILCPQFGSLLSAWGIGHAEMRAARQAGLEAPLDSAGFALAVALGDDLARRAREDLAAQGATAGADTRRLRVRYEESDAAIGVPISTAAAAVQAFETAHQRLFGFVEPGRRLVIASVEVEVFERAPATAEPDLPAPSSPSAARDQPDAGGPVIADALSTVIDGPRLIVRGDTQIWVGAGWRATPDEDGLIRLSRAIRPGGVSRAVTAGLDPVTLELFNRRFMGVAEAMGAALERTARSVNIKERLDFSCALFNSRGDLVANAPHMPVHLGSMGASVRAVQARHPRLAAGEAFALNNPYAGGTHLPDITVVMPVFLADEARPTFYVAARGHHADVGGVQPGSMPPFSRTIDEEGVLLDALPIMRDGVFLESDVMSALSVGTWPCRSPERNIGDLKAQLAACWPAPRR